MEIRYNEKRTIVTGELTLTPAFYADINSLQHWIAPHEDIEIPEAEKQIIISTIMNESKDKKLRIYFD